MSARKRKQSEHVLLSVAAPHQAFAKRVASVLEQEGFRTFIGGEVARGGVDRACICVVFASLKFQASTVCKREAEKSLHQNLRWVVLRVEDYRVSDWLGRVCESAPVINIFDPTNFDRALESIIRNLDEMFPLPHSCRFESPSSSILERLHDSTYFGSDALPGSTPLISVGGAAAELAKVPSWAMGCVNRTPQLSPAPVKSFQPTGTAHSAQDHSVISSAPAFAPALTSTQPRTPLSVEELCNKLMEWDLQEYQPSFRRLELSERTLLAAGWDSLNIVFKSRLHRNAFVSHFLAYVAARSHSPCFKHEKEIVLTNEEPATTLVGQNVEQNMFAPSASISFAKRGEHLMSLKRYKDAIDDFSHALLLNPSLSYLFQKRASCYENIGNSKAAAHDLERWRAAGSP